MKKYCINDICYLKEGKILSANVFEINYNPVKIINVGYWSREQLYNALDEGSSVSIAKISRNALKEFMCEELFPVKLFEINGIKYIKNLNDQIPEDSVEQDPSCKYRG